MELAAGPRNGEVVLRIEFEKQETHALRGGKLGKLRRLTQAVDNWPRALVDHLGLSKADYICRMRSGICFHVRGGTDDRHIIFEVLAERIYPVKLPPGSVVVDIGAQIGCFSVWAAQQGARVLAFEPYPPNFAALERNMRLNGLTDVRLFQVAVSDKREIREMYLPENATHSGRYSLHVGRRTDSIHVPCFSLGDVIQENRLDRIDLLKIDCQGSEYEIIYGAGADALGRTHAIIAECEVFANHPQWSMHELAGYLRNHGFTVETRRNILCAAR